MTLTNVVVSNSTATGGGGGIFVGNGSLTLVDSTISGNAATSGGGIFANNGATVTLQGATQVEDNSATAYGGGIAGFMEGTSVTLDGGGVDVHNNKTYGASGSGGGICMVTGSVTLLNGADVRENTAAAFGGGLFLEDARLTITGSNVGENVAGASGGIPPTTAAPGNGGAVYAKGDSEVTMHSGYVVSNQADNDGGAFWIGTGSSATLTGNIFANNADGDGGAIFYEAGGSVIANSVNFTPVQDSENTAGGSGAGIFGEDGPVENLNGERLLLLGSTFPGHDIVAGPGNDTIYPDMNPNTFTGGAGVDLYIGNFDALLGDTILDFSVQDAFLINSIGRSPFVTVDQSSPDQTTILFAGDPGIVLEGDFQDKIFLVGSKSTGPDARQIAIGMGDAFPTLTEGVAVADDDPLEQTAVDVFLGYNSFFTISVQTEGAFTAKSNAVGYYVNNEGVISPVTILSANAKNGGFANVTVSDGILTPFIIEDGFEFIDGLEQGDVMSIDDDGSLLLNGEESGQRIYHALDALNENGTNRVQYGFDEHSIRIGFEDTGNLGDRDFQDVIVEISLAPI